MADFETVRYDVADSGVATIALDQPDTRNALSEAVVRDLIAAFETARDDDAVRCVVLASTHPTTFSAGGNLGGFAADVPLARKHEGNALFPQLFALIGKLGKPVRLRRRRALPGGRLRARARVRPDRGLGARDVRHARDQRRGVPVHDRGADLSQPPAQEGDRADAARRADHGARGGVARHRQPRRGRGRVRGGRRRLGESPGGQVAAAHAARQGRAVAAGGPRARGRVGVPASRS